LSVLHTVYATEIPTLCEFATSAVFMNTKTATAPPTEGKQQESMKQANQQKKLIGR